MKRDMDLVRSILKGAAESSGSVDAAAFIDGRHDFDDVAYHVDMMASAGLIEATIIRSLEKPIVRASVDSLTWDGNDFLDAVSNDKVWRKVRLKVAQMAGAATFDVTKALAVKELGKLLG